MAKRPAQQETSGGDQDDAPITHPEEIRLDAGLTIGGEPTAHASIRTTPAGVMCAGLAVAAISLSTAALVRAIGRFGT
jgi:hypothetical protein